MRRLHVEQTVTLSLDDEPRPVTCDVVEVHGAAGRLAARSTISPRAIGRLITGWPGYLVFDAFNMAVGLRVAARVNPPYIDVAVIDGVAMPERRAGERVKLAARVKVTTPDANEDDQADAWTKTIDLSEHGALLRQHPSLDRHEQFGLGLMFGDDPEPVTAQAQVIRRLENAVAVSFESVAADDARRLEEYLMGQRHQRRRLASLLRQRS